MPGGLFHDIHVNSGMATSTFFSSLHQCIDAVNSCLELEIHFSTDSHGLKFGMLESQNKCSNGALDGGIGVLDGWPCHIQVPTRKETASISQGTINTMEA